MYDLSHEKNVSVYRFIERGSLTSWPGDSQLIGPVTFGNESRIVTAAVTLMSLECTASGLSVVMFACHQV